MELQEVVLRSLVTALRFPVSPLYPDVRGTLIEELVAAHKLTDWGWGDQELFVLAKDRTARLVASGRELRAQFSPVANLASSSDIAEALFRAGASQLHVERVQFIGVRTYWIAAADSFDAVHDWLLGVFSATAEPILKLFPDAPSDSGWIFEFHKKDPKHTLRVGPMTADQGITLGLFDREARDSLPPNFLFFDLDRVVNESELSLAEALTRWRGSVEKNVDLGRRLAATLTTLASGSS